MGRELHNTDEFRNASFWHADISGSVFRACDVNDVKIVGSDISNLRINGHAGRAGTVIVDDVDVTAYVGAELDRRFPELVQMRAMRSIDDFRSVWDTTEQLWAETVARAEKMPEPKLHERVDDEWSFVETLRHLVFATDVWLGRMLRGEDRPFHPLGLSPSGYPAHGAREIGLELEASPTLAEVLDVHAGRRQRMTEVLDTASDATLDEMRTGRPTPAWDEERVGVRDCLFTVIEEHIVHRRYAVRDLGQLEKP